jgi:hypothetical protein
MANTGVGALIPVMSYALDDKDEDEETKKNKDPGEGKILKT